ncbi:MAG: hypothetical protein NTZ39_00935 [Methanoregula sp.]|nr:hypothetical protein [Methanoregula sp.]
MNHPRAADRISAPAMDQFNYALRDIGEQTMHFVIAFDGQLDTSRLKNACAAILAVAPVLSCRFVPAPAPYWERITPLSLQDLIRVHPATGSDDDLQALLTLPCDPATSPPVRLDILRDKNRDTLCITVHHAAMDAHGLIVYAELLAGYYRDPGAWRKTAYSTCMDRSLAGILLQFPLGGYVPEHVIPEPLHPGWAFPSPPGDCKERAFAIRSLPPDRVAVIRSAAKAREATINDVLLAVFFSALCDYIHPEPGLLVPIMLSLDLRRYLNVPMNGKKSATGSAENPALCGAIAAPEPDDIANLSVAFNVMLPTGLQSPDARINAAMAAMREHKANNPGLASAIDIESFGYANFTGIRERVRMMIADAASTGANTPFLGNIGIIPDAATAFSRSLPVLDAFITGIVINPPAIALGVTTFCNRMTLSIGYGSAAIPRAQMEGFMDTIVKYLPGS